MALKAHSDPRPAWATAVIEGPCGLEVGGGGGGDGAAAICSDSGRGTFSSSPAFLSRGTLTERIVPPGVFTFIVFPVFPFGTFILNMRLPPGLEGEFMVREPIRMEQTLSEPNFLLRRTKNKTGIFGF